jgi:iron-sulfur cluster assembly protein
MLDLPISFSENAISEIEYILKEKNIPEGYSLRIGVKGGGGCGGATFVLGFDQKTEHDKEYKVNDFTVIIDKRHFMFLIGTLVDFEEGQQARGFTFSKSDT